MRFWLLFFSGIVAGYLAWTSSLFGGKPPGLDAVGDVDGAPEEARTDAVREGGWRFWIRFAVDGLSGRYLYTALRGKPGNGEPPASTHRDALRRRSARLATKEE
jgi:hypothetical protein